MLNILLCDDDKDELAKIAALIKDALGSLPHCLQCFDDPLVALEWFGGGGHIDVAVLDIIMPQMKGTELAGKLRASGYTDYIVFLTTSNNYAEQSYGVEAFAYLLKPASAGSVKAMTDRIIADIEKSDNESFAVKIKTEKQIIRYRELLYVEVTGHNLYFYLDKGRTLKVYAPLKDYADIILSDPRMLRANISFIVNIDYINATEDKAVKMRDGRRISVTGSFKDFKDACYRRMFGGE